MKEKTMLSRADLSEVTAGVDKKDIFLPRPPLGYKYCDYYKTCPNFDYRVCIIPLKDVSDPTLESSARGCAF